MLQILDHLENKIIILGSVFKLFLDSALEAQGGCLVLKNFLFQNSLKKNITYVTFGELEIQMQNASHFDKNITQVFYKED